jgi:hypothetical protein
VARARGPGGGEDFGQGQDLSGLERAPGEVLIGAIRQRGRGDQHRGRG